MFNFIETQIPEVILIEPQVFGDDRGFFMETYSKREFIDAGIGNEFVQDNHSKSSKGVLRGLHFQTQNIQAKLVRVISGSVYDVVVDIRKKSPTYGKWIGEILSAENKKQLFIPKGFAHGFLTLEDNTEFVYKCDDYYNPEFDGGVYYNDLDIGIKWDDLIKDFNIKEILLSEKDKSHMGIEEFYKNNPF